MDQKSEPEEAHDSMEVTDSEPDQLSELLDSCLKDFEAKAIASKKSNSNSPGHIPEPSNTACGSAAVPDASTWTEEFSYFNKIMESYMDNEGEVSDMKKWMESLSGAQNPMTADEDFAKTFTETLRELTEQAQSIPESKPEDLASLLGGLDLGDANVGDQLSDVMPLMQNVMQKLMSKEMLYPSIKEIVEKYPNWLRENQSTLKKQEYDNYQKQYDLMLKVCEEFEKDSDNTDASNKEQFENVVQLMQKIQIYGNPPKELLSNVGPGVPLDEQGNLQIPGMPQQCSIM